MTGRIISIIDAGRETWVVMLYLAWGIDVGCTSDRNIVIISESVLGIGVGVDLDLCCGSIFVEGTCGGGDGNFITSEFREFWCHRRVSIIRG